MKNKQDRFRSFALWVTFLFSTYCPAALAFEKEDSVKIKPTKRYIRPCLYFNHYSTPSNKNRPVKQYRFVQNNLGFYMPLFTNTWYNRDSVGLSSFHLLGVADMIQYRPQLDFINESYTIGRLSAGVRLFYGNGQKSVFYFAFLPFLSHEFQNSSKRQPRFTGAFVYSRTVSEKFAYRIGLARTYSFGRALHLPVFGARIGSLDKLHLNVQFPRNISLDFPLGTKVWASAFSKTMGGVYNVSMQDSLLAPVGTFATLRRFELLNGMVFSFRIGDHTSLYISSGFATRRYVNYALYEENERKADNTKLQKIPASIFISLGFSVHLGSAKKVYNNVAMYDMFDLNTLNKAGFNDMGPMKNDVPLDTEKYKLNKIKSLKYKDVEDLVTDDY